MKKQIITSAILLGLLVGCSSSETTSEVASETNDTTETTVNNIVFGSSITADNATIDGETVTITESGTYNVSGTSTSSTLVINDETLDVNLVFDNLNLQNDTAPLQVVAASSLTIELVGDSYIADGTTNSEFQAPIYIDEVPTTISGEGSLSLTGNTAEGLESNNDLVIESGTINLNAVDDGINVGDKLTINGGNINIDCEGDGLDSNGDLIINGGTMIVSAGNNANGPIDYNEEEAGVFEINGGTLIAAGGAMGVSPTTANQVYLAGMANGSTITIEGTDYEMVKTFSYVFVSSPDLTESSSVTVDGSTLNTSSQPTEGSFATGQPMGQGGPGF